MHGALSRYSGNVDLAARNEKHVPRGQLDLLVGGGTRFDGYDVAHFDGMRNSRLPEAPSFPAADLNGENIMGVPMRLERAALGEAHIGVNLRLNSHLSLDRRGELTDLRN